MDKTLERLRKVITHSELTALKAVVEEVGNRETAEIVTSKIADRIKISRGLIVNAFKLLEVAGIVETKSLGSRGTYVNVLNKTVFNGILSL